MVVSEKSLAEEIGDYFPSSLNNEICEYVLSTKKRKLKVNRKEENVAKNKN